MKFCSLVLELTRHKICITHRQTNIYKISQIMIRHANLSKTGSRKFSGFQYFLLKSTEESKDNQLGCENISISKQIGAKYFKARAINLTILLCFRHGRITPTYCKYAESFNVASFGSFNLLKIKVALNI